MSKARKLSVIAFAISVAINLAVIFPKINFIPQKNSKATNENSEPKRMKVFFKKDNEIKKQIVQNSNDSSETIKKPIHEEKSFLGEKDRQFEKQKKAQIVDTFKEAGRGVKNGNIVQTVQKKQAKKKVSLADFAIEKTLIVEEDRELKKTANLGVEEGKEGERGFASTNDHLEKVPLGDVTHLNTTEFKYYGFYHRIRQRLEQHWGATLREKVKSLYRRGGRIPASESRITSLRITIDKRGQIQRIFIKGASGITELDDAAVESFNKAGPFPNPPVGMLINDHADIEWGFVVKG